jgi:class 3 adenylate cyclase
MQQIAEWLENLGMSEYAQRFAENGIDISVLRYLTDQDLEKIGVLLGHRRKMLAATSELAVPEQIIPKPVAAAEPKARDSAERRQVTVMFSDLVGSTALSARMDPEDLREVVSGYQKCVAPNCAALRRLRREVHGRWRARLLRVSAGARGRAERTVRAGLELVAAVTAVKAPAPLQTRVAIATGLVVVGDLIGSGAAQEQAVVGETRDGTIVIRETPKKQLEDE